MAQNVVINSVTYNSVPQVEIPKSGGGTAVFYDTAASTAAAADVLAGETFYGASGGDTGTMPNNGATGGTITTKAGTVTIPAGYTTGGTVSLGAVSSLTSAVLKSGVTVLGITGSLALPSISQDSTTKVLSIS